jgi:hypothetical protein
LFMEGLEEYSSLNWKPWVGYQTLLIDCQLHKSRKVQDLF